MTEKEAGKFNRMRDALKEIAKYMDTDAIKKKSVRLYGLEPDEAIEMAYENVLYTAKQAICGIGEVKATAKA